MTDATVLTICATCRPAGAAPEAAGTEPREGAVLAEAARAAASGTAIETRSIACLSNCSRGCSATVAAPGKFSYVIGGLEASDAGALVAFAQRHAESADGIPAWRDRPEKIRKNTIARVPPPDRDHPLVGPIVV